MKIAIMQPYFFPYLGYFQLINCVDKFVFYDDVNFIKKGWINRNRILINGKPNYITIPLKSASQFKKINSIEFLDSRKRLVKTIERAYAKAPYFDMFWPYIFDTLNLLTLSISELAISSIMQVSKYLNINKTFEISSQRYGESQNLNKTERLIKICTENGAKEYINPIGGIELYNKSDFRQNGIELKFLKTNEIKYPQFKNEFVPFLSIIDTLMFNSVDKVNEFLNNYELI